MAHSIPLIARLFFIPALLVSGLLLMVWLLPLVAMAKYVALQLVIDSYIARVLAFTILQAALGALASIVFAIPLARALHRRKCFVGRSILLHIASSCFAIPPLVAVLGLVSLFGKEGFFMPILNMLGVSRFPLYGMTGIVLAHVFFNLPYALRIFLQLLDDIPNRNWKLASQLNMRSLAIFQLIEWPTLRPSMFYNAMLIFLVCFTSFTVVLTLGGNPNYSTLEVVIYQALKYDFDTSKAATLSLLQLCFCLASILIVIHLRRGAHGTYLVKVRAHTARPDLHAWGGKVMDAAVIGVAFIVLILPLFAIIAAGCNHYFIRVIQDPETLHAAVTSVAIAAAAGGIALGAGLVIVLGSVAIKYHFNRPFLANLLLMTSHINLAISPLMLATGFFLVARLVVNVDQLSWAIVMLLTGMIALPFVVGVLNPPLMTITQQEWWLCRNLAIQCSDLLILIVWPRLKKRIAFAWVMAMLLSWGDLGIISLFGNQHMNTLPLLLYQKMGSYRTGEAAVLALLLLLLSLCMIGFAKHLDKEGFHDTHY
jgi:thiamine transport system permease protein